MRPLLILQAERERPPGFVADFLARVGQSTIIIALERARPAPVHQLIEACAGLIVLDDGGAGASVIASRELAAEVIRSAVLSGRAICGLGSGAHLLSAALDAVPASEPVVEMGWLPATLRPEAAVEPWLSCLGTPARTVFLCHRQALVAPPGTTALLAGPQSRCVAYAGPALLGLHFHADLMQATFLHWLPALRAQFPAPAATIQDAADIAAGFAQHVASMRDLAQRLLTHWLSEIDA